MPKGIGRPANKDFREFSKTAKEVSKETGDPSHGQKVGQWMDEDLANRQKRREFERDEANLTEVSGRLKDFRDKDVALGKRKSKWDDYNAFSKEMGPAYKKGGAVRDYAKK